MRTRNAAATSTRSEPHADAPSVFSELSLSDQLRLLSDPKLARGLQVVTTLRIPEFLTEGPLDSAELAARSGANEDVLYRLLRFLASARVFIEHPPGRRFGLAPMGRLLCPGVPNSLYDEVALPADDRAAWWSIGEMLSSVISGTAAFDRISGRSFWESLEANPRISRLFQEAMSQRSSGLADALAVRREWNSIGTVVDVGGGQGTILAQILEAHNHLRGFLLDIPAVVEDSPRVLAQHGVLERCQIVPGDFFNPLPHADAYLLSSVLHNWPDDRALAILANCRESGGETSRVLIVEMEVGDGDAPSIPKAHDLLMLLLFCGKERTHPELSLLLERAGYTAIRRTVLLSPFVIVEGRA